MLRLAEGKIHGFQKQKQAGQKYTLPSMGDDGSVQEPQLLDDLIENWKKEKLHLEKVVAWTEERNPGSSRKGDGVQLIDEYESLFGKD